MPRKFLGQIIFLRHGQTEYTDVFPDLTPEGIKTIEKTAELIGSIINGNRNVVIFSSPKPRALGTADIIAKKLDIKKIEEAPAISAIAIKDKKKAGELFEEFLKKGIHALAAAYGLDPRFEDGIIVEPRSEAQKRFLSFFSKLTIWLLTNGNSPLRIIVVSHYEILYHLVENLFKLDYEKEKPLGHGEIIIIAVYDSGSKNTVRIEISFRKKRLNKLFDYKEKIIR